MKRALILVAALVAVLFTAAPASALSKIKCDAPGGTELKQFTDVTTFVGNLDPIVNHNQPESMHQHDFFGSSGWQATLGSAATHADIAGVAGTSCRNTGDTASYWAPSLVYTSGERAGQRVAVQQFTAYYRGFKGSKFDAASIPLPDDVRLVATDDGGPGAHGWSCGEKSAHPEMVQHLPDCTGESGTPGHTLTAHINFPSCWDGTKPDHPADEVGDTRDNAHWAYPVSGNCPAAFPVKVIQLRETIQYRYTGDGTDVALSSDLMAGAAPGTTMHADFWNTWSTAALGKMVADCINDQGKFTNSFCQP